MSIIMTQQNRRPHLSNTLQQHGIAVNMGLLDQSATIKTPWFVKLLAIGSGWLAAVFSCFIIGLLFHDLFKNEYALIVAGGLAVFVAYIAFSAKPSDFLEHLALAISLVGQLLITYAIVELTRSNVRLNPATPICFLGLHSALLFIMPNSLHRSVSGFAVAGSLALLFSSLGLHTLYPAAALAVLTALTLSEFKPWSKLHISKCLVYGFSLQFLFPVSFHSVLDSSTVSSPPMSNILVDISTAIVLVAGIGFLAKRYNARGKTIAISMFASTLFGLASLELSGIAAAGLILVLGFAQSNRLLMTIGGFSLLTQTSYYYYNLDTTLLIKSASLASLGVILLLTRWGLMALVPASAGERV